MIRRYVAGALVASTLVAIWRALDATHLRPITGR
jgi:hypothetical protein